MVTMTTRHTDLQFSTWPAEYRPVGYFDGPMTPEKAAFYRENGYLVVENALSPAELQEMHEETVRICRNEDGGVAGHRVFTEEFLS